MVRRCSVHARALLLSLMENSDDAQRVVSVSGKPMTISDISTMSGMRRHTVVQCLAELQSVEAITMEDGGVTVRAFVRGRLDANVDANVDDSVQADQPKTTTYHATEEEKKEKRGIELAKQALDPPRVRAKRARKLEVVGASPGRKRPAGVVIHSAKSDYEWMDRQPQGANGAVLWERRANGEPRIVRGQSVYWLFYELEQNTGTDALGRWPALFSVAVDAFAAGGTQEGVYGVLKRICKNRPNPDNPGAYFRKVLQTELGLNWDNLPDAHPAKLRRRA